MPRKPTGLAIQDGQTVVFIGDSITDTGRRKDEYPFGHGYVRRIIDLITARYPERNIAYYNRGISGNIVGDLWDRWGDDVIKLKPDWLSVLVGINDLHRRFEPEAGQCPPETYRQIYTQCLQRAAAETKARLVLMDPFYISTDRGADNQRGTVLKALPAYIKVVADLARQFDAIHIRLQDVFAGQLAHRPADAFCPEPVHPNAAGHVVIAQAWLAALDF
jgi:lysophospholipase L1-like esterase